VNWQLPSGLTAGELQWPTPRRLGTSSIVDFGYEDAVMLLAPIHADPNLAVREPAQLSAEVKVLVCREVCIPGKAQLSLTLRVASSSAASLDAGNRTLFAAARQSLPQPAPASWKFRATATTDSFILSGNLGHQIAHATFFPLQESQLDNAAQQALQPTAAGFQLTLRKSNQLLKPLEHLKGILVLDADSTNAPSHGYVIDVPLSKSPAAANSPATAIRAARVPSSPDSAENHSDSFVLASSLAPTNHLLEPNF
jgi:thiol:disulfide interchange protein DsbD